MKEIKFFNLDKYYPNYLAPEYVILFSLIKYNNNYKIIILLDLDIAYPIYLVSISPILLWNIFFKFNYNLISLFN